MRDERKIFAHVDWPIVLIYLALVIIGWINIYAAVYNEDHSSIFDLTQNYGKQLIWIISALVLAGVVMLLDPKFFPAFSYVIYALVMFLLLAVLFKGAVVSGSKSWFQIGSFGLQPSEFAKFATALALAKYMSSIKYTQKLLKNSIIPILIFGAPVFLILMQNDTGSALVFGAFVIVLYREGLSTKLLIAGALLVILIVFTLFLGELAMIIICVVLAAISLLFVKRNKQNIFRIVGLLILTLVIMHAIDVGFAKVLQPHQQARINVLLGKEIDLKGVGYNVHQSKIAIGSGGFWGKGFLQGTQTKYSFVPEQSTDFIFCTVGEEWGFVGSLVVIVLYVLFLIRIVDMAERQRSHFSRIYGYGLASIIFFHFLVNIGMTIGLLPVIGIPLPFISYGGSSLWAFTIMLFVFVKQDANRLMLL
ncbi:MAG: rod shape-determining protein RodA [Bacteroidales bacterium]|nr:rod shape-determining protein RodA [Bacteroidales bacterium]MDZ4203245.1 rod shape-determining protein RodA [Bacteroidales bacterium]